MTAPRALDELIDRAVAGATVVTATHRLARVVRDGHDQRAVAAGLGAWREIDVLPVDAWLDRSWTDALIRGVAPELAVLSGPQERALWEAVVPDLSQDVAGGDADLRLARVAADAWRRLREADRDESVLLTGQGRDAARVAACFAAFRDGARSRGWLDAASLPDALRAITPALPWAGASLVIAGFDRVPPVLGALLEAVADAGASVERWMPAALDGDARLERCETPAAEVLLAARWARAVLDADPDARIGVVVPDLAERHPQLRRAFEEMLDPLGRAADADATPSFSVSLGAPLARAPPVADALALIGLASGTVEPATLVRVLRSPYLRAADAERVDRARLARAVRADGETHYAVESFRALARRAVPGAAPVLDEILASVRAAVDGMPGRHGAGAWADLFWQVLTASGWPGETGVDSAEHQSIEALGDALGALAALECVRGPLALTGAFARLRGICEERVFAPRVASTRVEISGLLETGGQQYTHLRVLGMDDLAWPPPVRANPLLPPRLQAELEIPGSTPQLCLEHAQTVTARLLGSAGDVTVTCALRHGDEVRRASPLLRELPARAPPAAVLAPRAFSEILADAAPALEPIVEVPLPAVPAGTFVRGGARVLQDQAACGFRAFAVHRLDVRGGETRDGALDALARGKIAHAVLEGIWRELRDRDALVALPPGERRALVEARVEEALASAARERPSIRGRLREIEQQRLARLVTEWLELETSRPWFEVIAPERDANVRVGPLELALRPDRVDRLADGRHLVIDYKTGATELRAWFGERPDDPQVPLYASHLLDAGGEPLEIVSGAFGILRADALGLRGLGQGELGIRGVQPIETSRVAKAEGLEDWHLALERWRARHAALAEAFAAGRAEVDPRQWPATCKYCEVRALCRVDEQRRAAGSAASVAEEGA